MLNLERLGTKLPFVTEVDEPAPGLDIVKEVMRSNLFRLATNKGCRKSSSGCFDIRMPPETLLINPIRDGDILLDRESIKLVDVLLFRSFNDELCKLAFQFCSY